MANLIDVDAVNKWLFYDSQSGVFYWKESPMYKVKAGDKAGALLKNGCGNNYLTITVHGKRYLAHRIVATLFLGAKPSDFVDHINGDGFDNRLENLRLVSKQQNSRNMKISARCKTGIMGVSFCNKYNGYRVKIGRNRTISKAFYFKDFFEACCARKSLENEFNFDKNHGKRG